MKLQLLLFCSSFIISLSIVHCDKSDDVRQGRVLNRRYEEPFIQKQLLQEYSQSTYTNETETTADDVIEEIISSSRQGRNIEGLDDIYGDSSIKQALDTGNEIEARNLIRDKLCDLGLMQCDEVIQQKRPGYPTRVIYSQPPPSAIYNNRPPPPNHIPRPPNNIPQVPVKGIYGPPKPMPYPPVNQPQQPPRKIGYSTPDLNGYETRPIAAQDKYTNTNSFYEYEQSPSQIKFGYTEKPTIVVNQNQGKREAAQGVQQNHHIHHHYVHVDGSQNVGGLVDGTKTVLVNTPISEYSAVNQLSSSYQTSGFGTTGASSNVNGGFTPMNNLDYKGVNSGNTGVYSANSVKPVYESSYASGTNFDKYQQTSGPAVYTEGTNGIYNSGYKAPAVYTEGSNGIYNSGYNSNNQAPQSFHSTAPDFYKKELNLNRGSGYSSGNGYTQQQQLQQNNVYSSQKQQQQQLYSKNQYNNIGEQYQGFETSLQNQYDCVCTPFDQCPAQDIVGRRDDLILPLDPRNLPSEIEADGDNSTLKAEITFNNSTLTEVKKISKRDVEKVQGEGRLFGSHAVGGGGGYYPGGGGYPGGKKILPTLGVSFGLPFPTYNYPISPYAPHAPNAHFGAISPNGLNLGLLNVNPLFSLQVTKNEIGEKLVKPFVNLHVTPNENIIGKIGAGIGGLFAAKKGSLHNHYHHHLHRYPPPPSPYFDGHHHHHSEFPHEVHPQIGDIPHVGHPPFLSHPPPPHFENGPIFDKPHGPPHFEHGPIFDKPHGPPHFENGPIFDKPHGPIFDKPHGPIFDKPHGPPHIGPNGPPHIFSEPPPSYFKDNRFGRDLIIDDISINPGLLGFRSNNISINSDYSYQSLYPQNHPNNLNFPKDELIYARGYSNQFDQNEFKSNNVHSIPTQAPGNAEGSEKVSFPTSRRRRDTDQKVPASIEKKVSSEGSVEENLDTENDSEGRALNGKRQAYYQPQYPQQQQQPQQKQCGPRAVCCRKPFRAPQQIQQAQYNKCGVRNTNGITGRIKNPSYIDGDSEFGEWPWQAAILKKDPKESVYVCGGTLISDSYIVTAAHCVKTYSGFDLRVRLGEWDVNHDVEFYPYVERDVISVHVHPEYYAGTLDNDLAILKLSAPVDFSTNPHVTAACLPDKFTDFSRQRCWTTGWGKDNWEYGKYQNILKEVDVPIIDQNTCQNQLRQTRLGHSYVLNPGFICAGGEEGKDACKGDGGGPLVCERNGVWQLVGAVSWGIGCGQPNVPGVYVRISHYLNWINQITQRY